jgi:hypothetical protein
LNPFLNSAYFLFCVGQDVNLLQLEDISVHRSPSQTRVRHPPCALPCSYPHPLLLQIRPPPSSHTLRELLLWSLDARFDRRAGQGGREGGWAGSKKGVKAAQRKLCTPRILRIFFLLAPECQRVYLSLHSSSSSLPLYFCFDKKGRKNLVGAKAWRVLPDNRMCD